MSAPSFVHAAGLELAGPERGLQLVVAGGHDLLAALDAVNDLDLAVVGGAERDLTLVKRAAHALAGLLVLRAIGTRQEDHFAARVVEHRALGDEHGARPPR